MRQSKLPLKSDDWGILYGFGLFETFLVNYQGTIFLLEEHLSRLLSSARFFKIPVVTEPDQLKEMIAGYLNEQQLWGKIVRLTLLAGNQQSAPSWHFSWRDSLYDQESYQRGFKISVSPIRKSSSSILLAHKTNNYLENFWLSQRALQNGTDDLLFLNTENWITETTKSNVFFVKKGIIYTPQLDLGLLPGIMRGWVLREAARLGLQVVEGLYSLDEILNADEIFLTNSAFGVMPVTEITAAESYQKNSLQITNLLCEQLSEEFTIYQS